MNAPAKLGAYAAVLVAVLAVSAGIGVVAGPLDSADAPADHAVDGMADAGLHQAAEGPAGLRASEAGFAFAPDDTSFTPAATEAFTFRILGPDGAAVTAFDNRHEKDLHLVVVSDDLRDYQHLHPARADDGTWTTPLDLPRAGSYRAYADFAPTGSDPLTLGVKLTAVGQTAPEPLPAAAPTATVDGYEVRLAGTAAAGADGELRFEVWRDGTAVRDLEPYLGAYGHLVAIRAADHGYLHVHPTEASSPEHVAFAVHVPSGGAYRLFLDFRHDGVVHTAAFTFDVAGANPAGGHEEASDDGH